MVNGILGGLRMKSRPKVWDKISRFSRLKWTMAAGKLSRESKFIFITTWKAVTCRVSEIIWKCMVVKVVHILWFMGKAKSCLFLHLIQYKQSVQSSGERERPTFFVSQRQTFFSVQREDRHLSSQTKTPNAVKMTCWILLVR